MIKISNTWIKHLKDKEEKEEFTKILLEGNRIIDRLINIVEQELDSCKKQKLDKSRYLSPNWSEFQADTIGEERALRKILNLIKIER